MLGMGVPLRSGGNRQDFVLGRKPMLIGLAVDAAVRGPDLVRSLANAVFQSSEIAPRAMPGLGINGMHPSPHLQNRMSKQVLARRQKLARPEIANVLK
jgi:hypothetical protein